MVARARTPADESTGAEACTRAASICACTRGPPPHRDEVKLADLRSAAREAARAELIRKHPVLAKPGALERIMAQLTFGSAHPAFELMRSIAEALRAADVHLAASSSPTRGPDAELGRLVRAMRSAWERESTKRVVMRKKSGDVRRRPAVTSVRMLPLSHAPQRSRWEIVAIMCDLHDPPHRDDRLLALLSILCGNFPESVPARHITAAVVIATERRTMHDEMNRYVAKRTAARARAREWERTRCPR